MTTAPFARRPVRRFMESDLAAVADVHRQVFGRTDPQPADVHRRRLAEAILSGPRVEGIASLVYEEDAGSIAGFQGVQARRMLFDQRPITMAVLCHLCVRPERRGLHGLKLLQRALDGPQELSIADEANDVSRAIWERCGGVAALLYSMHWVRPLRPCQSAVALLLRRRSPRAAAIAQPLARALDAIGGRRLFPAASPAGARIELDESAMSGEFGRLTAGRALRPDYADGSLRWILQRAATREAGGPLRRMMVIDAAGSPAGWFLYYSRRGGIAEVLQIVARPDADGMVIDHLIEDAAGSGAIALAGRLDPPLATALSERQCAIYRRGHWMLVHSRRSDVLQAVDRGDAFLSRLEGEWCLHLR